MNSMDTNCKTVCPWRQVLLTCLVCIICAGLNVTAKGKHGLFTPKSRLTMRVNDFKATDEWSAGNITMSRSVFVANGEYAHDFDLYLTRDMPETIAFSAQLTRCSEAVSSNTCEYFKSLKFQNLNPCDALTMKGAFWETYTQNMNPKLSCPMKAGYYTIRNATVDVRWFETMGMKWEDSVWQSIITVNDSNGERFARVYLEVQFFRLRT